ncbi:unnamed protein product [Lota lota]
MRLMHFGGIYRMRPDEMGCMTTSSLLLLVPLDTQQERTVYGGGGKESEDGVSTLWLYERQISVESEEVEARRSILSGRPPLCNCWQCCRGTHGRGEEVQAVRSQMSRGPQAHGSMDPQVK